MRRLRRRQYRDAMLWYGAFRKQPSAIAELREMCLANLRSAIDDPALVGALTPDYDPGCKRILVSDDYYPALAQPHVRLVPHGVQALTPDECGGHRRLRARRSTWSSSAPATGLGGRADGRPALEVYGRGGRRLAEALAGRPQAYLGIAIPGFPNYFTVCGINGNVAYGALIASAEVHTEAIAAWAARLLREDLHSVEVRADATERFSDAVQAELQHMSWAGDCPNFYRDANGRIVSFFPGTVGRLRRELRPSTTPTSSSSPAGRRSRSGWRPAGRVQLSTNEPAPSVVTVTVSPSAYLPSSSRRASWSPNSRWMTRRRGRAPKAGS